MRIFNGTENAYVKLEVMRLSTQNILRSAMKILQQGHIKSSPKKHLHQLSFELRDEVSSRGVDAST